MFLLFMWIAIWLTVAAGCAEIAEYKHRSWWGWFWLGMLFGVFSLLAILLMRPIIPPASTRLIPCKHCHYLMPEHGERCPDCGAVQ